VALHLRRRLVLDRARFAIAQVDPATVDPRFLLDEAKAERIASRAESMEVARDVESFLRGELKKLCPDSAN